MTERSSAFVNGPVMVEQFTGVAIDTDEFGGSASHARYTGVATLVVPDRDGRCPAAIDLLGYLPDNVDAEPSRWPTSTRRPSVPRGRRPDPRVVDRQLRRPQGGGRDRRRGLGARSSRSLGRQRRHRVRDDRRAPGRHRREPADGPRRNARHPGVAEGSPVHRVLRCLQPPDHHARRHARLLPGQGPRMARDDPPRRPAGVRLRPRECAPDLCHPPQELRRRVHRDGLQDDGQRPVSRVAVGRDRRHGCRPGSRDPRPSSDARGAGRVRGRLRRTAAQPLRRRRARVHRCRHRSRRHPRRDQRQRSTCSPTSARRCSGRKHGNTPL